MAVSPARATIRAEFRFRTSTPGSVAPTRSAAAISAGAFLLPFAITAALMMACGVFREFRFWTLEYPLRYVTGVPPALGWEFFKIGAGAVLARATRSSS